MPYTHELTPEDVYREHREKIDRRVRTSIKIFFSIIFSLILLAVHSIYKCVSPYEYTENTGFSSGGVITDYSGSDTHIDVPTHYFGKPVTEIGERVYAGCQMQSVHIHSGIDVIGDYAFSGCDELCKVMMMDGVREIGEYSFSYCTKLSDLTLPNELWSIGHGAFMGCDSLVELNFPDSVLEIGDYAFAGCNALETVDIGGVNIIGAYAFQNCTSLAEITLPDSEMRIGDYAFAGCHTTIYAAHEPEWYGLVPRDYENCEWVIVSQSEA